MTTANMAGMQVYSHFRRWVVYVVAAVLLAQSGVAFGQIGRTAPVPRCSAASPFTLSDVNLDDVSCEVQRRLDAGVSLVFVCLKREEDPQTRGILNAKWRRRLVAEILYPGGTETNVSETVSAARFYHEVNPPIGSWEIEAESLQSLDRWFPITGNDPGEITLAIIENLMSYEGDPFQGLNISIGQVR